MRFPMTVVVAVAIAALAAPGTLVSAGQQGAAPHAGAPHGHPGPGRRHIGHWHGASQGGVWTPPAGPGVPPGGEVPAVAPPPRPYGGCMPTAPRYDAYGAYVAGGC